MIWKLMGLAPRTTFVADKGTQKKQSSTDAQTRVWRVKSAHAGWSPDVARGPQVASDTNPATATQAGEERGLGHFMIDGIRQRVETKLADLKLRLHLTDQQMQQASQMIEQRLTQATPLVAKIFEGKDSTEINEALATLYDGAQADLQQLLSAEQWAEYQQAQTEDRQSQAERMAAADLEQLKGSLQLTDQQFEAAYAALSQYSFEFLQQTQSGLRPPADLPQYVQQTAQAKEDALRPVLTPDQFQKYDAGVIKYVRGVQNFLTSSGNRSP